jgi:hypothetical protein
MRKSRQTWCLQGEPTDDDDDGDDEIAIVWPEELEYLATKPQESVSGRDV